MGLLERRAHHSDRRSSLIEVTEAGQEKLDCDPLGDLIRCFHGLPEAERKAFGTTLKTLGKSLSALRGVPMFGKCDDCSHCEARDSVTAYCRCTQQLLTDTEMSSLCVDYLPNQKA